MVVGLPHNFLLASLQNENEMRISDIAEKNSAFEARFEAIDENIEGLKREEVKLLDDVYNPETERAKVSNQINILTRL